jgi:hypothetical protein
MAAIGKNPGNSSTRFNQACTAAKASSETPPSGARAT